MSKTIITGAAGNIGAKLRSHLEARGEYELVLIDRDPRGDPEIIEADLSIYEPAWVDLFERANAIVHLAANPDSATPWHELIAPNCDAVLNVFQAAVAQGARRVVFASSVHAMGLVRDDLSRITPEAPPRPGNAYGAAKLIAERIGKSFAERQGISVICLRFGSILVGDNDPSRITADWHRHLWCSDRDVVNIIEHAVWAEHIRFAVLNAMSANSGSPWDVSETARVLGYQPQDDAFTHVTQPRG